MVSIVVPVYNAENYIERCIKSILKQTYEEWELILVDNGSLDGSLKICEKYAKQDGRIFVIHQFQNKGVSVARNLGLEKVTGEFITFIDADDWIQKDCLEYMVKLQKDNQSNMVVCGYKKVYEEQADINFSKETQEDECSLEVYDTAEYMKEYLLEGNTHCWGVLYSLELLESIKFPVGMSIGEDLLFLIDAALQANKIVVTDYAGYNYYINESGAMKKKFTPSYMDQITCWQNAQEKILQFYPKLKDKLDSILLVSVMLVVGKLSELEKEEQKQYEKQLEICLELIRKYEKNKASYSYLPAGYFIKIKLFSYMPSVYLKLYGEMKR